MENQLLCLDAIPKFLNLFDFSVAPPLLFYAYIPIIIIVLFLSVFILVNDKFSLKSKTFFIIGVFFSAWIINMIVQWTGADANLVYFSWKITAIIEIIIPISTFYFLYILLNNSDNTSDKLKIILFLIIIPVMIFLPTKFNMSGFDIESCAGNVGPLLYYVYFIEILLAFWIIVLGFRKFYLAKKEKNNNEIIRIKRIIYLIISSSAFLIIFSLTNIFGELTKVYEINLFGPIGMIIFLIMLSYHIVNFKTFNIKLLATQALVWGLVVLIGSQFFFIKSTTNFILNGVTFVGIVILGQFLIRSVKKEVEQRERLEILTTELSKANEKLKGLDKLKTEFVSLASHQLRSPLTAIKGYTSMLLDGDYGNIDPKAKETIERVMESSNNLTMVVEDLLNVSKIESGGMRYEMASFDLSQVVKDEAKDLSMTAEKKGLKLNFESADNNPCIVKGDKEKIRQVIINFIDNSIKYTKEGSINVSIKNKESKVIFAVKDTGMGMTEETKNSLFQKFARGDGARMNTTGTGLGLYLAKQIVEAHKGRVWVESDGVGKGSAFYMELDTAK